MDDPFTKLPTELQLQIFLELDSLEDVKRLSFASLSLFRLRGHWQETIDRHFCARDLHGDLLQDALAVLLFPAPIDRVSEVAAVAHFTKWGLRQLADPFKARDRATIKRLVALMARVRLYMGDFISKATSPRLIQARFHLPRWAHPSFTSREHALDFDAAPHRLSVQSLYPAERARLMRAFLRHEMLCKAYQPRLHDDGPPGAWYKKWDWTLLDQEPGSVPEEGTVDREDKHAFEAFRDTVMLQCVHQYLRGLYGAIAIRIKQPGWFPAPDPLHRALTQYPSKSDLEAAQDLDGDLVLPADFDDERLPYFANSWTPTYHFDAGKTYDSSLVAFGLDLLDHLLTNPVSDCETRLNRLFHEVMSANPSRIEMDPIGPSRPRRIGRVDFWDDTETMMAMERQRQRRTHIMTVCRHRAWALFDDGRLYPELCDYSRLYLDEACEQRFWQDWDGPAAPLQVVYPVFKGMRPKAMEFAEDVLTFPSRQRVQSFWLDKAPTS